MYHPTRHLEARHRTYGAADCDEQYLFQFVTSPAPSSQQLLFERLM
jgi:hypothetical protein